MPTDEKRLTQITKFMGPIWGRQDPGGPHVGPMNLAIRVIDAFHRRQLRWALGIVCPRQISYGQLMKLQNRRHGASWSVADAGTFLDTSVVRKALKEYSNSVKIKKGGLKWYGSNVSQSPIYCMKVNLDNWFNLRYVLETECAWF